ncbi:MAG: hypothetical protein V5A37_07850 [Halobacteriales archaeon]
MGEMRKRVLDEHALEEQHIPVPAGHAPRLEARYLVDGFRIQERQNPDAYVKAENPTEVRE